MPAFSRTFGHLSPLEVGFLISFIMLMGAVPGCFAGKLAHRFGHLRVITSGGVIFAIGSILQATAFHLPMLLLGRALAGLGEGLWLTNVSV